MLHEKPALNLIEKIIWNVFLRLHNRRKDLTPISYSELKTFFDMEGFRDLDVKKIIKDAIIAIDNFWISEQTKEINKDV